MGGKNCLAGVIALVGLVTGCSPHAAPEAAPRQNIISIAPKILSPEENQSPAIAPVAGNQPAGPAADNNPNVPLDQMLGAAPVAHTSLDPRDAAVNPTVVVQLSVYEITVPAGTVSKNDDFWRHADENVVDPATHDQLWRNGMRVGLASQKEWDYFKKILARNPAVSQRSVSSGTGAQQMVIPVRQNILYQLICYMDGNNELAGRSFERSENFIAISFMPSPRKPGSVRVEACPVVRAERTELVHTVRNNEVEIQEIRPEHFYDVNLKAEIPAEKFLIISPSPEASSPLLLGHAFLCVDGVAERYEKVLILSPQPFTYDALPTTRPAPER